MKYVALFILVFVSRVFSAPIVMPDRNYDSQEVYNRYVIIKHWEISIASGMAAGAIFTPIMAFLCCRYSHCNDSSFNYCVFLQSLSGGAFVGAVVGGVIIYSFICSYGYKFNIVELSL